MTISNRLRPLREEERNEAYNIARGWVAGKEPQKDQFKSNRYAKFPPLAIGVVFVLCLVVLGAAFVPSAYRLHFSGSSEFCKALISQVNTTLPSDERCNQVGIATILLAEVGQMVFMLALAVLPLGQSIYSFHWRGKEVKFDLSTFILWAGALLSTLIAFIGNAHFGEPWRHGHYLMGYFETFAPPLMVMGTGYVLKELLLVQLEGRHAAKVAYEEAMARYRAALESPETHPKWLRYYSRALKEAIERANSRLKPDLQALEGADWEYLVRYEMKAGDWYVDPNPPPPPALTAPQEILDTPVIQEEVFQMPDGQWMARSRVSGKEFGPYNKEWYARNAIANHNRQLAKNRMAGALIPPTNGTH